MAKGIFINEKEFRSFDQMKLEKEIATRSITSGSFLDWFNILPDPDPILRKLGQDVTVYKDLSSDDQVGSTIIRLKNEVKALEWQIQAGEDSGNKEVDLCKLGLKNLSDNEFSIKDAISQSLEPHFWGLSVFEAVWEKKTSSERGRGKNWLPVKLQLKPMEWFKYDSNNYLRFITTGNPEGILLTGPEADPSYKYRFFILRNEPAYDNPYGARALSRCFWPVTFKRGGLKFLAMFVEKYGMPHVTIKHPPGYTDEDVESLVSKASRMIQDAVAAIPDGNQIEIH